MNDIYLCTMRLFGGFFVRFFIHLNIAWLFNKICLCRHFCSFSFNAAFLSSCIAIRSNFRILYFVMSHILSWSPVWVCFIVHAVLHDGEPNKERTDKKRLCYRQMFDCQRVNCKYLSSFSSLHLQLYYLR